MSDERKMSQTYYDKADEARAFADYAPFRYGQVAMDPEAARRIKELRASLDPILVDIVDGGVLVQRVPDRDDRRPVATAHARRPHDPDPIAEPAAQLCD